MIEQKGKFFKFFFIDIWIRIMIENEIYWYVNGFLKWNICKNTSKTVGIFYERFAFLIRETKEKSLQE